MICSARGHRTRSRWPGSRRGYNARVSTRPRTRARITTVAAPDLATAEDVVQDAFERVHRRWHRLR